MTQVIGCIDASRCAPAVCDYATWASQRLSAPLTLLHVLDHSRYPVATNLSGNIGLGSRENLLQELANLDEQRSRLALEQGRGLLEAARERARTAGVADAAMRQRHGSLVETLRELEEQIRLLVIGRQGEDSQSAADQVGSQLESVIRLMHRPVLVTPAEFRPPRSLMLAFDGSATTRKGVAMLAASPLAQGLPVHLLMIAADSGENRSQLESAGKLLQEAGLAVTCAIRSGEIEPALHAYQAEHDIDLLVMGAYGHSRIREFLIGSTTASMLRTTRTPLLMLR